MHEAVFKMETAVDGGEEDQGPGDSERRHAVPKTLGGVVKTGHHRWAQNHRDYSSAPAARAGAAEL